MNQAEPARIFVSYSHRGDGLKWKSVLLDELRIFEQHHLLDVWQDGKIRVSSDWDDDIRQAISRACLAVVLLSEEALQSEYIIHTEFPLLRERHQQGGFPVFPVICDHCDLRPHDWLRSIQAPNAAKPLAKISEVDQRRVFRTLASDIAEEISRTAIASIHEFNQPHVPTRVYLDKFPLENNKVSHEDRLFGREQEMSILNLSYSQPKTTIVSVVGWGGAGKTMLVKNWLRFLQRKNWLGLHRVYSWNFYSQGTKEDRQSSDDTFLAHAIDWFGVQCEPALSPWDKGRLLANALTRESTLLVLDGIEPLQYPPGPMGGKLRALGVQSLLKELSNQALVQSSQSSPVSRVFCLITTREAVADIADFQRRVGSAWGSGVRLDLCNLTDQAGAALLYHVGANRSGPAQIRPDDKELLAASRIVGGHALTLNLLGRFVARAHNGDIQRSDLVKFEEADRKEQGGATFKMLAAFEGWFAKSGEFGTRQLAVLRMLGLFDRPADSGCIAVLRKPPVIAGLTDSLFKALPNLWLDAAGLEPIIEEDWNTAISFLVDFGLAELHILAGNQEYLLDCHPLIREYFRQQLRNRAHEACSLAHRRLYEHLSNSVEQMPNTLEGLQPLYYAVTHGCAGGLHEAVCNDVLGQRIRRGSKLYSLRSFGIYGTHLAALSCFFDSPWTKLSNGLEPDSQAWLLNDVGYCLRALGRISESFTPIQLGAEIAASMEDLSGAAMYTSNLSEVCLTLGSPGQAVARAQEALAIGSTEERAAAANYAFLVAGDNHWQIRRRDLSILAHALLEAGHLAEAIKCFQDAENIQTKHQPQFPQLYSTIGFYFCDALQIELERTAWKVQLALRAETARSERLSMLAGETVRRARNSLQLVLQGSRSVLDIALNRLTLARSALYAEILQIPVAVPGDLDEILESAVEGLRSSGSAHHIPRGLLSKAWLNALNGNWNAATSVLDDAWDIAERGPMRLHMADIHLSRARLFFREVHYPWKSPMDDIVAARELIQECDYGRRKEELEDAEEAAREW